MVCCAAHSISEEDEEGRARVGRPQREGEEELESDDGEDNPLCEWFVSHQLCHLKFIEISIVSVMNDGGCGLPSPLDVP